MSNLDRVDFQILRTSLIKQPVMEAASVTSHPELLALASQLTTSYAIQPVVVRKQGKKYVLIRGEPRYRATLIANITKLPCIVLPEGASELDSYLQAVYDTLYKEPENALDMAKIAQTYVDDFKVSLQDVADLHGEDVTKWSRILKINQSCESLQNAIREKRITSVVVIGLLIDIYQLNRDEYEKVFDMVLGKKYAGQLEQFVKGAKRSLQGHSDESIKLRYPAPNSLNQYSEFDPGVNVRSVDGKGLVGVEVFTLKVGPNQWCGGYKIQATSFPMVVPISDAFRGVTELEVIEKLYRIVAVYLHGLQKRINGSETKKAIMHVIDTLDAKLRSRNPMDLLSAGNEAVEPHLPVEGIVRDGDHLIVKTSLGSMSLSVDSLLAYL